MNLGNVKLRAELFHGPHPALSAPGTLDMTREKVNMICVLQLFC